MSLEEKTSKKSLLILVTNMGFNREHAQNQLRAFAIMDAKKIPYETLDGADPVNKDARNELFRLSGKRGVYPQFFLLHGEERIEFLGVWEKIEAITDASELPDEILEQNPEIVTWEKVLY